jgi:hypothetical protein
MFIKVVRPEGGEPVEVSEKLFNASLNGRGWTLAKVRQAAPTKEVEESAASEKSAKKDK